MNRLKRTLAYSRGFLTGLVLAAVLLVIAHAAFGQTEPTGGSAPAVTVRSVPQKSTVQPGDRFAIAVVFDHAPGFHTWPHEPVLPPDLADFVPWVTDITIESRPDGVLIYPIQWPEPHAVTVRYTGAPTDLLSYEGRAIAYIPVAVAPTAAEGELVFDLLTTFQACDDMTCQQPQDIPQRVTVTVRVAAGAADPGAGAEPALFTSFQPMVFSDPSPSDGGPPPPAAGPFPAPAVADATEVVRFDAFGLGFSLNSGGPLGLILILLVAALGGLLLNFTPCVLPVIPIKILGLSQAAKNPRRCLILGAVMALGVVAFWAAAGAAIAVLGVIAGVNELFRQPLVGLGIGLFIAAMGIGSLGLFSVRLPQAVYMVNPSQETVRGSFLFGIMTAVLATPCVAPFMGTAMAWAGTQPAAKAVATFIAIGVGMALPYLILAANPRWVERMPRTGPASELIKQVMGMLMLAVATFFIGTGLLGLIAEHPYLGKVLHWWVVAGFATLAALWLLVRTVQITPSTAKRVVFGTVGALIALGAIFIANSLTTIERRLHAQAVAAAERTATDTGGPRLWASYTPELLESSLAAGKVVVVDFTAEWCLICKTLKLAVLSRPEVESVLQGDGVVTLLADLTNRKAPGWAKLHELGESGIPLLLVYAPGQTEPLFKSNAYTQEQVIAAVARARPQATDERVSRGADQTIGSRP